MSRPSGSDLPPLAPADLERAERHYFGRVQGVGFRQTTARIARRYAVTGYVRNQRDGSVELVVEGAPGAVREFLAELETEQARFIVSTTARATVATGEFTEFAIRLDR